MANDKQSISNSNKWWNRCTLAILLDRIRWACNRNILCYLKVIKINKELIIVNLTLWLEWIQTQLHSRTIVIRIEVQIIIDHDLLSQPNITLYVNLITKLLIYYISL